VIVKGLVLVIDKEVIFELVFRFGSGFCGQDLYHGAKLPSHFHNFREVLASLR
jgi:hypothetical protein